MKLGSRKDRGQTKSSSALANFPRDIKPGVIEVTYVVDGFDTANDFISEETTLFLR